MQDDSSDYSHIQAIPESALGPYGDVPIAYAAFRIIPEPQAENAADALFVYANDLFCELSGRSRDELIGLSLKEAGIETFNLWSSLFYRSAMFKETLRGDLYDATWDHWLNYNIAPSPVQGCCVATFAVSDVEHHKQEDIVEGLNTADLIIGITETFNSELDYENAIYGLLEMVSGILHPERIIIIERGQETSSCTFELCAEGVPSRIEFIQNIPNDQLEAMAQFTGESSNVLTSNPEELKRQGIGIYKSFNRGGINRMIGVVLVHNGQHIGYMSASNYTLQEGYDAKRVLDTVAPFVSARIVNQRLVNELEYASTHDALTGSLNRHGLDLAIGERLDAYPDAPFVLALIDIDDFKAVNDTHGHEIGDHTLQALSEKLGSVFEDDAIIGRNGGDEFLLLLFNGHVETAYEALRSFVESDLSFERDGRRYSFSVSIGYTAYPEPASDLRSAYIQADAAMYEVKRAGKSGVCRYSG